MGPDTADESLSLLYRTTFQVRPLPTRHIYIQDVCQYLAADPLSRGPNFHSFKWVQELNIDWDSKYTLSFPEKFISGPRILAETDFPKPIYVLVKLTTDSTPCHRVSQRVIEDLECFKRTYEVLHSKGHAVTIKYHDSEVDSTDFYWTRREEWEEEMEKAIKGWDWLDGWWNGTRV